MKSKRRQKRYDEFMNEQFRILKGHFSRCMLRCFNKQTELENEEIDLRENRKKEHKKQNKKKKIVKEVLKSFDKYEGEKE
ncbi:MAG: hypothetical protein ACTSQ4_02270 [Candidatus Heimdallarchaeaceae archaeon]